MASFITRLENIEQTNQLLLSTKNNIKHLTDIRYFLIKNKFHNI